MEENITNANQKKYNFREIFASSHVNFLFGAGVNGNAFKQLKDFVETLEILKDIEGDGLESKLNNADGKTKENAINKFCEEFTKFNNDIDFTKESINNIKKMFVSINKVVNDTENRNNSMKKINVFTLNYDSIIEDILNDLGYFFNQVTVKKLKSIPVFDIIGYNLETKRYMPTYCIAKLHGTICNGKITRENIIYPGLSKYSKALDADYFEVLFKMKSELFKFNSTLIIIGYSGYDEHINRIIKESINNGLTVFWFKWNKLDEQGKYDNYIDEFIKDIHDKIQIINPVDCENKQDTTLTLSNLIESMVFSNDE